MDTTKQQTLNPVPMKRETEAERDLSKLCQGWRITRPTFNAFARAIEAGRVSLDPHADNFLSRVWWRGTQNGKDRFQYLATGKYVE